MADAGLYLMDRRQVARREAIPIVVGEAVQEFDEICRVGLDRVRAIRAWSSDGDFSEATKGEKADPLPAAFEYEINAGAGSESVFVIERDDFHLYGSSDQGK